MTLDGVDLVIRMADTAELPGLKQCLFTVLAQTRFGQLTRRFGPLFIRVMTERFTIDEIRLVRGATAKLLDISDECSLSFHNWDHPHPFNLALPLLHWALDISNAQYFACLDINDRLMPGALEDLLQRLRVTNSGASLGGVQAQHVAWAGDIFLPIRSVQTSPTAPDVAPICMLDRARLPRELSFSTSIEASETAGLISNLRTNHSVDDLLSREVVCVRQIPNLS